MANRFRSNLTVSVEFSPGAPIGEVCVEIVDLAQRLWVWVEGDFNGVKLLACPFTDREELARQFTKELESKKPHKIAVAH